MTIRPAQSTESDMLLVFDLSNDSVVRESSFNTEYIPKDAHQQWYSSTVFNVNVLFFLCFIEEDFVGQVRFSRENESSSIVTLSLSIIKKYRGMSIGKEMLDLAVSMLKVKWINIRQIEADVKTDNYASNSFFIKKGFTKKVSISNGQSAYNTYILEI